MSREENVKIFQETQRLCKADSDLVKSFNENKDKQFIVYEKDHVEVKNAPRFQTKANVIVTSNKTFQAAEIYKKADKNCKVAVLNFASSTNPGGGVVRGSSAQEESLCRASDLYKFLNYPKICNNFHDMHRNMISRGEMNALYNGDCIYTPNVTVFRSDKTGNIMPKYKWFNVDVITCAAPNLRTNPSNQWNPNSGEQVVVKNSKVTEIHKQRAKYVLDLAVSAGADYVILGAFGCGAFKNNPMIVADAWLSVVKDYLYQFKGIEFAVYCSPRDKLNYSTFVSRLNMFRGYFK